MNTCTACGERLPAGATKCPLCLVPVHGEEDEVYNRFTSPLPRGGRAIVCTACQGIISADVSTL